MIQEYAVHLLALGAVVYLGYRFVRMNSGGRKQQTAVCGSCCACGDHSATENNNQGSLVQLRVHQTVDHRVAVGSSG